MRHSSILVSRNGTIFSFTYMVKAVIVTEEKLYINVLRKRLIDDHIAFSEVKDNAAGKVIHLLFSTRKDLMQYIKSIYPMISFLFILDCRDVINTIPDKKSMSDNNIINKN